MGDPNPNRDSKGRFAPKGGVVLGAITLAIALAAGTGFGATGSSAAKGSRGKARDHSTSSIAARLAEHGLHVRERAVDAGNDCAARSYGDVQAYFRAHPCSALFRALLEVRDERSAVAVLAVAWVDMPDAGQARDLQRLTDRYGTGNVTELGSQRFTGRYYRSAREDTTVVNVQAEPVGRAAAAAALAELAVDAAG